MHIAEITALVGRRPARRRLGRGQGSGLGKTSGRGHKGAGSRSGWKTRGFAEGGQVPTHRRFPKRGFSNAKFTQRYSIVNIGTLEERFKAGGHVTAQSLAEVGLVRNSDDPIKILGNGVLSKKLIVEAAKFSQTAKEMIEKAGGEAKIVL